MNNFSNAIRNAKCANSSGTIIDCEYNHPVYGWIPFTASPDDVEELGRTIFQHITESGDLVVAPYTPPTDDELSVIERAWRDEELRWWDVNAYRNQFYWSALTANEQEIRDNYRQELLDYPQKNGFPFDQSLRPVRIEITE